MGLDDVIKDVGGSIWGWVSELPGEAVRTVKGAAEAVYAPFGFVADIAGASTDPTNTTDLGTLLRDRGRARFADSMEALFGADSGLGAAFSMVPEAIRSPIAGVAEPTFEALDTVAREVIREPASALFTAGSLAESPTYDGSLLNFQTWKDAYAIAQERSVGQALVLMGTKDILDAAEVDRFKGTPWFDVASGTVDFAANFIDVVPVGAANEFRKGLRPSVTNATDQARFYSDTPDTLGKVQRSHWTYVRDEVRDVTSRAAEAVQRRASTKPLEKLELENNRVKAAEDVLRETILEDPEVAAWVQQAYKKYGMSSVEWTELVEGAHKHLSETKNWDSLPDRTKEVLRPQIEQWMRSSTNTDIHDVRTLQALIGGKASTNKTLYRGFRAIETEMQNRGDLAASRGGRKFEQNPAEELEVGEQFDIGAWSFSESEETAKGFGDDTVFIIDEGADRASFGIPEPIERDMRLSESEHLVNGKYEVVSIEKEPTRFVPTMGFLDGEPDVIAAAKAEVGQKVAETESVGRNWLGEAASRFQLNGLWFDGSEVQASEWMSMLEDAAKRAGRSIDDVTSRVEVDGETYLVAPHPNSPTDLAVMRATSTKGVVKLKRVGDTDSFQPKTVKKLHRVERALIKAKDRRDDAKTKLWATDIKGAKQKMAAADPVELRFEVTRLQSEIGRLEWMQSELIRGRAENFGAGMFLRKDRPGGPMKFDTEAFNAGEQADQMAFIETLQRALPDAPIFDALDELANIYTPNPLLRTPDDVLEADRLWGEVTDYLMEQADDLGDEVLARAKARREAIAEVMSAHWRKMKGKARVTDIDARLNAQDELQDALKEVNERFPSYTTNPFVNNEDIPIEVVRLFEAGLEREGIDVRAVQLSRLDTVEVPALGRLDEWRVAPNKQARLLRHLDEYIQNEWPQGVPFQDGAEFDRRMETYIAAVQEFQRDPMGTWSGPDGSVRNIGDELERARTRARQKAEQIERDHGVELVRFFDEGGELDFARHTGVARVPDIEKVAESLDPRIGRLTDEVSQLNDIIEVRKARMQFLRKAQRENHRKVADASAREIAARVFPGDPWGEMKGRMLALAPDDETFKWTMQVLTGKPSAIKLLEKEMEALKQQQKVIDAARREARPDAEPFGQLELEFDLEKADRVATLVDELKQMQITHGLPRRFTSTLDKQLSETEWLDDLTNPDIIDATARDTMRRLDTLEGLRFLSDTAEYLPRRTIAGDVKKKGRDLGWRTRRSSFYRASHIGGKVTRLAMAPFDERAFPTVNFNDAPSTTRTIGAMMRQAGLDDTAISKWQSAVSDQTMSASQRSVEFDKAVRAAYEHIARDFGIPSDVMDEVIEKAQAGRKRREARLNEQRYAAEREGQAPNDLFPSGNGNDVVAMPLLREQTRNSGLVPDFTTLRRDLDRMQKKALLPETAEWRQMSSNQARYIADTVNSAVKLNLVMRPAWMLRVIGFDEGLRPLAIFGTAAMKQWPRSLNRLRARYAEQADKAFHRLGIDPAGRLRRRGGPAMAAATGAIIAGPVGLAAGAGVSMGMKYLRRLDDLARHGYDEATISSRMGDFTYEGIGKGQGEMMGKALSQRDGLIDLIAGEQEALRRITSAEAVNWKTVVPGEPSHLGSWQHVLTKQYGQNDIVRQLHEGKSVDDIVRWIESSKGADLRKELPVQTADPYDYVERIKAEWEDLTVADPTLAELAVTGKLRKQDLEDIPVSQRPNVNGPEVAYSMGDGPNIGKTVEGFVEGLVQNLAEIPSDELARQPMFDLWYRRELKRLTEKYGDEGRLLDENGKMPTEVRKRIEASARNIAFQKTKDLMYEFAAKNEFHRMVRFISPFFSAAQEAWQTWAGIAWEHPVAAFYAGKLWQGVQESGIYEEDEDGRGFFYLPIPERARGILEDGTFHGLASQGEVAIPLSSFNLILDGEVLSGPFMQLGAGAILRRAPQYEEVLDVFAPYGAPDDNLDALLGGVPSSVRDLLRKEGSDKWMGTYLGTLQTYLADVHTGKRDYDLSQPSEREQFLTDVDEAAKSLFTFRIAATAFSPVTVIPQSPYRFYIERAQELKSNNPENWFEDFYDLYGEDLIAVASGLTKTKNGVPPTQHGFRQYGEFKELIDKHPEFGAFIVGDDAANDEATAFSGAVYDWQKAQSAAPGSREMQRDFKSAEEVIEEPGRRAGWLEYVRAMDYLDVQLSERGLVSFRQKGAEDLQQMKQAVTEYLGEQYPEWWEDFNVTDRRSFEKKMEAVQDIVAHPKLEGRADVQAMRDYLEVREYFLNIARERGAARSLQTVANQDIYAQFQQVVQYLSENSPAFGPVYYRYFERDPLEVD